MNCTECREHLIAYIEGLAQKGLEQEICAHLGACAACQQEEKAVRGLQDRLVTQGQSMPADALETAVLGRIVREQKSRMHRAEQASAAVKLRSIIMKSSISRIAMAAAIVVACLIGVSMFRSTSSITLAGVLDRINLVTAYMYQTSASLTVPDGIGGHTNQQIQATELISRDYGSKSIADTLDVDTGKSTREEHYMLPQQQAVIRIMPDQKQYSRTELDESWVERMEKQNNDPRAMIKRILKCEHISLGRSTMDGIDVEGFQTTDPAYAGVLLGQVDVKLWINADTWLPYRIEMDTRMGETMSSRAVISDFQWDVSVDVAEFDPVIPDDYTSLTSAPTKMPAMNEETLLKGLRLCVDMKSPSYPDTLSMQSMVQIMQQYQQVMQGFQESGDKDAAQEFMAKLTGIDLSQGKPGSEQITQVVTRLTMTAQGPSLFYSTLVQEEKDPAYYGDIVTPQDADQVLVRWKLSDSEYRVIFGDLRTETVSAEVLAELEKALPQ